MVPIEFDPAKDAINRLKHGLSLADAAGMAWATAVIIPDRRADYGEFRYRAYGIVWGRLHMVAFTLREDRLRIISFRRANQKESRRYGQAE